MKMAKNKQFKMFSNELSTIKNKEELNKSNVYENKVFTPDI